MAVVSDHCGRQKGGRFRNQKLVSDFLVFDGRKNTLTGGRNRNDTHGGV